MPRHDRRYRSRFRDKTTETEEEQFSLNNYERKPFNLSRKMILWTPIMIVVLIAMYFLHDYLTGG